MTAPHTHTSPEVSSAASALPAAGEPAAEPTAQPVERRAHSRQRVCRVEVRVASRDSFRASYLRDLSMGGLFVRCARPLPLGAAVVVELTVDARTSVRLRGTVTRHERGPSGELCGFGVRLSEHDGPTKQALRRILRAQQRPAPPVPWDHAEEELAEARSTLETYEEALALLREREAETAQQLEVSETERAVLVSLAHELQGHIQQLEADGASMRARVERVMQRLARREAELKTLTQSTSRLTAELATARTTAAQTASDHERAVTRLVAEFVAEAAKASAQQAEWDEEVRALKEQIERSDETGLRAELREFSSQLSEERLKSMALQRALQRFQEMGAGLP